MHTHKHCRIVAVLHKHVRKCHNMKENSQRKIPVCFAEVYSILHSCRYECCLVGSGQTFMKLPCQLHSSGEKDRGKLAPRKPVFDFEGSVMIRETILIICF